MPIPAVGIGSQIQPPLATGFATSAETDLGKIEKALNHLIRLVQQAQSSMSKQQASPQGSAPADAAAGPAASQGEDPAASGADGSQHKYHHKHHHHKHHHKHHHPDASDGAGSDGGSGSSGSGGAAAGAAGGHAVSSKSVDPGAAGVGSKLSTNLPKDMEQYRGAIEAASARTGVPANRIAAVIWAESRGNLNHPESSRNSDGTTDYGLMQIGQKRYDQDIRGVTGGPALDVRNSADNIMAGAFELKKDFMEKGNWTAVHEAYIGHGNGDDAKYAAAVNGYAASLDAGNGLKDSSGF